MIIIDRNELLRGRWKKIKYKKAPPSTSISRMDREWRTFSTKLAAGLRSVARNYKATRLLTRPG